MAKKNVRDIVHEAYPDAQILEEVDAPEGLVRSGSTPVADDSGPSLEQLRAKFRGKSNPSSASADSLEALRKKFQGRDAADAEADEKSSRAASDVEVVRIRSKHPADDPAHDPGSRAIIVSKSKGILGSQG